MTYFRQLDKTTSTYIRHIKVTDSDLGTFINRLENNGYIYIPQFDYWENDLYFIQPIR